MHVGVFRFVFFVICFVPAADMCITKNLCPGKVQRFFG